MAFVGTKLFTLGSESRRREEDKLRTTSRLTTNFIFLIGEASYERVIGYMVVRPQSKVYDMTNNWYDHIAKGSETFVARQVKTNGVVFSATLCRYPV